MNRQMETGTAARGADLVHTFLDTLDGASRSARLHPSHVERLSTVEEACRLVADAAADCPRALRPDGISSFRALVTRLAMEVEDPTCQADAFPDDDRLGPLEAEHGSVSAALHGLSAALGVVEAGLQARVRPVPRPRACEGLGRIRRDEARAWARQVDAGLAALERDVIRAGASAAVRRDAWSVACILAVVAAQAADNACVEIGPAMERLAEAGSVLAQAVAVAASEAAASGRGLGGDAERALMALVPVVDSGMRLMRAALQTRDAARPLVTWRLISRGRTGLTAQQVEGLVRRASGGVAGAPATPASISFASALSGAASEYEGEWGVPLGHCA